MSVRVVRIDLVAMLISSVWRPMTRTGNGADFGQESEFDERAFPVKNESILYLFRVKQNGLFTSGCGSPLGTNIVRDQSRYSGSCSG